MTELNLLELVQQLLTMGGVAAAIIMIINVLAFLGVIPTGNGSQGTKKKINTALQLLALVGLWVVKTFTELDLGMIDEYAQNVADLGVALLALVPLVLKLSPGAHDTLAESVKVIGFSESQGDRTLWEHLGK